VGGQFGKVGEITQAVIEALGLSAAPGTPIFIGLSNVSHMMNKHPEEYVKYGAYIHDIVNTPDYVGLKQDLKTLDKNTGIGYNHIG
jgi:hypothetical protein